MANEVNLTDAVWVWGVPLAPLTMTEAIAAIGERMANGPPGYVITANLNYAMLTENNPRLSTINAQAALILADGMPLVWASRLQRRRLPERVTGVDMLFRLCEHAAQSGFRLYLLGGEAGIVERAAANLIERYPSLQIVGMESPPFREWTADEREAILGRIRTARPHLLLVAFGQPKGEYWIADHWHDLQVPVAIQIGAALDFAAGKVRRAPKWIQRCGLEWGYRLAQEPRRLIGRYCRNGWFVLRQLFTRRRPST